MSLLDASLCMKFTMKIPLLYYHKDQYDAHSPSQWDESDTSVSSSVVCLECVLLFSSLALCGDGCMDNPRVSPLT